MFNDHHDNVLNRILLHTHAHTHRERNRYRYRENIQSLVGEEMHLIFTDFLSKIFSFTTGSNVQLLVKDYFRYPSG